MRKNQKIHKTKKSILVNVDIVIVKDGDYFIAYCPALQVSSYSHNEKEARSGFDEALQIFVEETEKKGSFEKVLLKMGWSLRQVPAPSYVPPKRKRSSLSKFKYGKPAIKFKESIALPL
jgi:predicted RNase H-like HicB family nuclease